MREHWDCICGQVGLSIDAKSRLLRLKSQDLREALKIREDVVKERNRAGNERLGFLVLRPYKGISLRVVLGVRYNHSFVGRGKGTTDGPCTKSRSTILILEKLSRLFR